MAETRFRRRRRADRGSRSRREKPRGPTDETRTDDHATPGDDGVCPRNGFSSKPRRTVPSTRTNGAPPTLRSMLPSHAHGCWIGTLARASQRGPETAGDRHQCRHAVRPLPTTGATCAPAPRRCRRRPVTSTPPAQEKLAHVVCLQTSPLSAVPLGMAMGSAHVTPTRFLRSALGQFMPPVVGPSLLDARAR